MNKSMKYFRKGNEIQNIESGEKTEYKSISQAKAASRDFQKLNKGVLGDGSLQAQKSPEFWRERHLSLLKAKRDAQLEAAKKGELRIYLILKWINYDEALPTGSSYVIYTKKDPDKIILKKDDELIQVYSVEEAKLLQSAFYNLCKYRVNNFRFDTFTGALSSIQRSGFLDKDAENSLKSTFRLN